MCKDGQMQQFMKLKREQVRKIVEKYKNIKSSERLYITFNEEIKIPTGRFKRIERNWMVVKSLFQVGGIMGYMTERQTRNGYRLNDNMVAHFKDVKVVSKGFNPEKHSNNYEAHRFTKIDIDTELKLL